MNARIRKMIPTAIRPGLRLECGHYRVGSMEGSLSCNQNRLVDLYHPGGCRTTPARRVSVAEWQAGR